MVFLLLSITIMIWALISLYREQKQNIALTSLQERYRLNHEDYRKLNYSDEFVRFISTENPKFYVNGMRVASNSEGIFMKGGFIYPWIKSFFIPWENLKWCDTRRVFFKNQDVYLVQNTPFSISLSRKYRHHAT